MPVTRKNRDDISDREIDIKLEISKKASTLGRNIILSDVDGKLDVAIPSNTKLMKEFIEKNPVHRGVQCYNDQSEHEVNTERVEYLSQGMNHVEGGWPKDINPSESDQTMRFRKKIEKDDNYVNTILKLCQNMEECIKQNNSVEIYEDYFDNFDDKTKWESPTSRTVHVFCDPVKKQSGNWRRPISAVSWCPDGGSKIAIAYCNMSFQGTHPDTPRESYVFNISDPTDPYLTLYCPSFLVSLSFNPKEHNILAGGCYNGQVCYWDCRVSGLPQGTIELDNSHADPVNKTIWMGMKNGAEFFTSSTDGTVKWWDMRKFTEPTDMLIMDASRNNNDPEIGNAQGITCLEFEPTVPTKFMVGTERGNVFLCNRKAKTPSERITATYSAHFGSVYSLQRNPCFPKNFLTVGDWCARIWSEDIKDSSIMATSSYTVKLSDGCWSPTRPSVFFTTRYDGCLDCWDVLYKQREPVLSIKLTDHQLNTLSIHDSGLFAAVGCNEGNVTLLELSGDLASSNRSDKTAVTNMFERETRREKILEARNKEMKLKEKARGLMGIGKAAASRVSSDAYQKPAAADHEHQDVTEEIMKAETAYFGSIKQELERRKANKMSALAPGGDGVAAVPPQ